MSKKVIGKTSAHISIKQIIKEELKPVLKKLDKIEKDLKDLKKNLK